MGALGLTVRNALLNLMFGNNAYSPPATYYYSLTANDPGADGNSGSGEPAVANGYARKDVTNDTTLYATASTLGSISNSIAITFPLATGTWGTDPLVYFAIWKHATLTTTANFVGGGLLPVPKTITAGDTPSYAPGTLVANLT